MWSEIGDILKASQQKVLIVLGVWSEIGQVKSKRTVSNAGS